MEGYAKIYASSFCKKIRKKKFIKAQARQEKLPFCKRAQNLP